jgi:class 3 adenylate cyclase
MTPTAHRINVPLAILFADISGSTRLYESLGNSKAQRIVTQALVVLTEVVERHGGKIVKSIGDELMCTFGTADQASTASNDMHQTLRQAVAFGKIDVANISIRVGFHFGPVIQEKGDVFGDAVNVAARLVAQAKAQQVLTSKETLDMLLPENRSKTRFIDRVVLKGKQEELEIYEVLWEQENLTIVKDVFHDFPKEQNKLRLRFRDREFELSQAHTSIKLGRGEENDIVVTDALASRSHARIELRRDKFVLVDQSINGTFVQIDGERELRLRRDELPLRGSGRISLGRSTEAQSEESLHFTCEHT